jgi:selenocysteine lyase/cysteine desulfurase
MQGAAEDVLLNGSANARFWAETYEGLRASAARLIGARADEIAIVKNTTEGLAIVANGLDWRTGDVVVGVQGEFPANYYPWENLRRRGVDVRWVPQRNGRVELADLDEACRGAKLLAISWIQYLSGFRLNLEAIGEICARRGCLFVLDAIQGLGVFPIDVGRARVHALAAAGHKWLCGPEGCGVLYVSSEVMAQVGVAELGWTSVAGWRDYQSRDLMLRPGAARYECGTLATALCYGLHAALELMLDVGTARIGERVLALAQRIACGAAERGYEVLVMPDGASGSGIVAFRKPDLNPVEMVRRLAGQGIALAARSGWIRPSPHFYVSDAEVERLLAFL